MRALVAPIVAFLSLAATADAACPDDCSLNGVCQADGTCTCDEPWSGNSCGIIDVLPAQPGSMYGYYGSPNVSSWGGNAVRGEDGTYHLYVAEMASGGLAGWGRESECTHATAPSMQGPYQKQDTAVSKWCHNPYTVRHPGTGEYMLFHIGSGNDAANSSGFMHHAAVPSGPWLPALSHPSSCNNPAPAFHPNGTLFIICNHMSVTHATADPLAPNNSYSALRPMRKLPANGTIDQARHWEDPSLWFDRRGHWHVLYHVYCLLPYAQKHECASGHAFSRNGLDWTFSNVEPYSGLVNFTDGTAITFSTRERPHVVFAPSDAAQSKPIGVVTAVSPQQPSPACDTCRQGACSQCKVTPGRDFTYTQLQPFRGFAD